MVKRLQKMLENKDKVVNEAILETTKVDIGSGVIVEKVILERLERACQCSPGKFARSLLRHVFTEDELRGKTLFGTKSNLHKDRPAKGALDPIRTNAVIGYTCSKFSQASITYIKNSLASMLAREMR
ncbi:uncharacterized protein LOC135376182 [Ornithodoros turicata]|uniref:uncharacterized protein LOC135376182 n=1 Tax=Ornithodoros turicata TaxID=34597 RepID=UPI003139440D